MIESIVLINLTISDKAGWRARRLKAVAPCDETAVRCLRELGLLVTPVTRRRQSAPRVSLCLADGVACVHRLSTSCFRTESCVRRIGCRMPPAPAHGSVAARPLPSRLGGHVCVQGDRAVVNRAQPGAEPVAAPLREHVRVPIRGIGDPSVVERVVVSFKPLATCAAVLAVLILSTITITISPKLPRVVLAIAFVVAVMLGRARKVLRHGAQKRGLLLRRRQQDRVARGVEADKTRGPARLQRLDEQRVFELVG